jgi:hypothetical protein
MTIKDLRRIVKQIESIYPAMYPISVSLKELDDCDGYTHIIKRRGKLRIELVINSLTGNRGKLNTIKDSTQLETLVHELAHAIQWRPQRQEEGLFNAHHGEEWGIALAKIYRLMGE